MKLYYSPGACSLSPHIVLRETGHTFDMEQVDLGTKKTKSGADFLKINPKGYVPALLLDSGDVLTEGPAIVQYLADKAGSKLIPANGSLERYKAQEWLNFTTSEMHKSMGGPVQRQASRRGQADHQGRPRQAAPVSGRASRQERLHHGQGLHASSMPTCSPCSAGASMSASM